MIFVKSNWQNLILLNYKIDPELLLPFVPVGTTLDFFENNCYVSLVAFMFADTRVLGLPIPFHVNFEEVNLRFYVKPDYDETKRSVVFLKEIVPRKAIELIANSYFKENYRTAKMKHSFQNKSYSYSWLYKNTWNKIDFMQEGALKLPLAGSLNEFITEHYWGYTKDKTVTWEYEVKHPQWEVCNIETYEISVDFAAVYGEAFGFLTNQSPASVCFAKGSEVQVLSPKKL